MFTNTIFAFVIYGNIYGSHVSNNRVSEENEMDCITWFEKQLPSHIPNFLTGH
jgi:hypothetical protein